MGCSIAIHFIAMLNPIAIWTINGLCSIAMLNYLRVSCLPDVDFILYQWSIFIISRGFSIIFDEVNGGFTLWLCQT